MPTTITTNADERSTYIVTCVFTDEDDVLVVPESIKWSLTNTNGLVINARNQVVIAVPDSSIDVVLSGDDLDILGNEGALDTVKRHFIVEAEYDSAAGTDLPLNDEMIFSINNLTKIV